MASSLPSHASVGPWVLMESLGRGGQGSTFKARHAETGQLAAVKRFRVAEMSDWKRFELFEREAATLAALDHPAIPRLLGSGAVDETSERWIAMELVDGEPLSKRLGVPSSPELVARIFAQALDVLAYLHGRVPPVVHRDLKPHNLLLRKDGRLAVVDFGSVRTALAPDGSSTVVGTFGYLAPEQLHGAAGPASDLYSLGVTMIALASGIEGASLPRRGLRIDAERVLERFPDPALARVFAALVAPEPEARPRDVAAVRALLQPEALPAPLQTGSAQPPAPLPPLMHWTPRGPIGRLFFLLLLIVLRIGTRTMGLVERRIMPRIQARERLQLQRRTRKDPVRQAVALAQLAHRHELQRVKLRIARDRVDEWRGRLQGADHPRLRNR